MLISIKMVRTFLALKHCGIGRSEKGPERSVGGEGESALSTRKGGGNRWIGLVFWARCLGQGIK